MKLKKPTLILLLKNSLLLLPLWPKSLFPHPLPLVLADGHLFSLPFLPCLPCYPTTTIFPSQNRPSPTPLAKPSHNFHNLVEPLFSTLTSRPPPFLSATRPPQHPTKPSLPPPLSKIGHPNTQKNRHLSSLLFTHTKTDPLPHLLPKHQDIIPSLISTTKSHS
ncbi:hypothetical protein KSP39_PZI014151 [Platanthera zijinensis]|uniref:Uncharacterized protein n=1 Tax=Platanthera zijinensis TaxID=2320716 RepID=A0AAP0G308_9ASPA